MAQESNESQKKDKKRNFAQYYFKNSTVNGVQFIADGESKFAK